MSRESENAQNISFLLRTVPEEVFSFVVVQCNHASVVSEIEIAINSKYPNRKIQKVSYPLPSNKTIGILAEEMGEGVLMVPNFEEILKDQNSWRVFNQTRDQVSSFQISLIVFIPVTPSVTQFMMGNMRDFWSIRNLVVEFWKEPSVEPVLLMDPFLEHSTDANLSKEEKAKEEQKIYAEIFHLRQNFDLGKLISDEPTVWAMENELAGRYIRYCYRIHYYAKIVNSPQLFPNLELSPTFGRYFQIAYKELGDFETAEKLNLDRLNYYFENFDLGQQILYFLGLLNLCELYLAQKKLFQVHKCLAETEEIRQDHDLYAPNYNKILANFWGYYYLFDASGESAITSFQSALEYLPPDGDQLARNMVVSNLAEAYLVSGDYYTAYETANQAYQEVRKIGDLYLESILLFQLGRIKVAQGLPELGKPHLDEAIRISQYLGSPKLAVMEKFVADMQS
jgi:tetratricopeptide (TPR) repeat protein